jgi:membrane associated rhomboid family serine protease
MVMLPLRDYNPLARIRFQYVTVALIGLCSATFLWQQSLAPGEFGEVFFRLGMIPAVLLDTRSLAPDLAIVPAEATLVTSMFLHAGWLHLLGNMLYLWIFGDNIEDAMGHGRFVVFYLLCGLAAAAAHIASDPGSAIPTVGASGAIAGVLGGYLLLHPKARVLVLLFFRFPVRLPAVVVLGFWIALQIFSGLGEQSRGGGGVAWWAHIGGFAAGLVLVPLFRKRHIPLFDRPASGVAVRSRAWGRGRDDGRMGGQETNERDTDDDGPWGKR